MTYSAGKQRQYYCDCPRFCKTTKAVSKATYYSHRQYRESSSTGQASSSAARELGRCDGIGRPPEKRPRIERVDGNGPMESPIEPDGISQLNDSDIAFDRPEQMQVPATSPNHAGSSTSVDPGSLVDDMTTRNPAAVAPNDADPDETHTTFSCIDDVRIAQEFIEALKHASLDNGDLMDDEVYALLNPPLEPLHLDEDDDKDILLCLRLFLAQLNSSQRAYTDSIDAIKIAHPDGELLSYDQITRRIAKLSGVKPIGKDMCPNSCMAYTGPFSQKEFCLRCGSGRYDPISGKSKQQFWTIPIGPIIQALKRDSRTALEMDYLMERLEALLTELQTKGAIDKCDDLACGSEILEAFQSGLIKRGDTVLIMSFDGAQLYRNKASDCWIYIWILANISPGLRYKKKLVIPGGVIPGKPKIVESFFYPGFHHIEGINKLPSGGLPVWDARRDTTYISRLFIALATADGPGMVYLNGLVGHSGKIGCRLWCGIVGRHKYGVPHYYPVLFKPTNYDIAGCDHDDLLPHVVRPIDQKRYITNLTSICASRNQREYELRRRETGICKPSIFSGFTPGTYLGIPNMFPGDIMHLILNLADLLMNLWQGKLDCASTDSTVSWTWAVLRGNIWKTHGQDVANCTPYLPGSFDRPPRNPAEKINSGYKAWEFLLYIFGLGPGLLYGILPPPIWRSFCKLVLGIRTIYQRSIARDQLRTAHLHLIQFTAEFEILYVQRRADRIHFVRQSIHSLSHLAPEASRIGPGICYSQWTMERSIGNLTEEIRQDSTPYANLSRRAVERAQINALKAMIPTLDKDTQKEGKIPRGACDLGHDYILLRAMDTCARDITDSQAAALKKYLDTDPACNRDEIPGNWDPTVVRWSRLRLPNGQVARSAWKECLKPLENVRMARNVKLQHRNQLEFAEVQFYFRFDIDTNTTRTLAMASLYSRPDLDLLKESSNTLWSCKRQGDDGIVVVDVKRIEAVVAMVPHSVEILGEEWGDRVFVVEKPGLDLAAMGGVAEAVLDES